mmetsp:Transcript_8919/g.22272  ORF Transcript_8919/g.22272 Transcript_8919/m.22272 type:complete len:679 (+) Transcript_8919:127-2163(+)|eukprot:CAMPEP_0206237912 /NCGR_PEP_ID=MMETSP0047_2-20121206/14526_1 /ASSEMBLY_ACC=CAM_ASM_000192 /TAXON_ID=195065 /ORGANISM="Chroomonas mesostigmatica_cf, Strain CCMP1168" /LENGTH=678 /DNA_ID=CAMNT_0053662395 /DNA_START=102 /DNA_END=2138 /DNA_ORIENTATION=-
MVASGAGLRSAGLLVVLLALPLALARPTVRNVKTNAEFKKLLKHHAEVTGLPVIVDFYSDGCGPCRMVAPHYKKMAEQYKDKAVFAKVDINYNRETASAQMISSMPTFQMYLFGKKRDQFSGADTNRLNQMVSMLVRESQEKNVEVTHEALKEFYATNAPEKAAEMDDKKLQDILDKAGKGGGPGHFALVKALKKKYNGKAPKTRPRTVAGEAEKPAQEQQAKPKAGGSGAKADPGKPNLHLASVEQLQQELAKRKEEEEERRAEQETEEDEPHFPIYDAKNRTLTNGAENVVIIGSGPAGLSAAVYAARAGLRPVVAAPAIGGQLQGKGVDVENYPGVNMSTGPTLVYNMQMQAAQFGTVFEQEMVVSVDLSKRPFMVRTNDSDIQTHSIIIATGADSKWLGVPGEWEHRGGGVSSCATCDGFLYSDKDVVVIGGGDAAMEDALVLARTSTSVTLIHRRDSFRASKVLAERVLAHPKITVLWNTVVEAFEGKRVRVLPNGITVSLNEDGSIVEENYAKMRVKDIRERLDAAGINYAGVKEKDALVKLLQTALAEATASSDDEGAAGLVEERMSLTRVRVKDVKTGEAREISCEAAFVAIGHDPNTKLLAGQVDMDATGYIVTRPGTTKTSVEGVYAAGDVADHVYRQAITSAGTGAMAALDAERWLSEQGFCTPASA